MGWRVVALFNFLASIKLPYHLAKFLRCVLSLGWPHHYLWQGISLTHLSRGVMCLRNLVCDTGHRIESARVQSVQNWSLSLKLWQVSLWLFFRDSSWYYLHNRVQRWDFLAAEELNFEIGLNPVPGMSTRPVCSYGCVAKAGEALLYILMHLV